MREAVEADPFGKGSFAIGIGGDPPGRQWWRMLMELTYIFYVLAAQRLFSR